MGTYQVNVAADGDAIVLQASGHLDARAGRHLLEVARVVVERLCRTVWIDLGGVTSSTPGVARLFSPQSLHRLPGVVEVRGERGPCPRGFRSPAV